MVGWRLICCACWHEKPHWWSFVTGQGCHFWHIHTSKKYTRSSTEAELVAMNEVLPQVLWTCYFLEAQGYGTIDSIVYQDNQSAVLLERMGMHQAANAHATSTFNWGTVLPHSFNDCRFLKTTSRHPLQEFWDFIMNIAPGSQQSISHRSVLEHEYSVNSDTVLSTQHTSNEWTLR